MADPDPPLPGHPAADIEICNVIDDHSRLLVASIVRPVFKTADVVNVFIEAFSRHGRAAAVLTDNGPVFSGASRGGRVALAPG